MAPINMKLRQNKRKIYMISDPLNILPQDPESHIAVYSLYQSSLQGLIP